MVEHNKYGQNEGGLYHRVEVEGDNNKAEGGDLCHQVVDVDSSGVEEDGLCHRVVDVHSSGAEEDGLCHRDGEVDSSEAEGVDYPCYFRRLVPGDAEDRDSSIPDIHGTDMDSGGMGVFCPWHQVPWAVTFELIKVAVFRVQMMHLLLR